jgi:hypothetical protein
MHMNVIQEARAALKNVDPNELARVASKHGVPAQAAAEKIASRLAVIDGGGAPAARMASVVLGRKFKGV